MPQPRAQRTEKVRRMKYRLACGRVAFPPTDAWNPGRSALAFCQSSTSRNADAAHCTRATRSQRQPATPPEYYIAACERLRYKTHRLWSGENVRRCRWSVDGKPWSWSDQCSPQPDRADTHDVRGCRSTRFRGPLRFAATEHLALHR